MIALVAAAGCGEKKESNGAAQPARPAPPPDAGTQRGHGADPRMVAVPDGDATPPTARIVLSDRSGARLAQATVHDPAPPSPVRIREPRFTATTVGEDGESGVARVRVSLKQIVTCRDRASGREFRRPGVRYLPPPATERVRAAPGASLPTRARRTHRLSVSAWRCGRRATATAATAEVWGEAINGLGLEAVTQHVRFAFRPVAR